MLSVVIILSGIAWVILIQPGNQLDNSLYSSRLQVEEEELLKQFHRLQEKYLTARATSASGLSTSSDATPRFNTASGLDSTEVSSPVTQAQRWKESVNSEQKPAGFLHNNPWSPDYQHGY